MIRPRTLAALFVVMVVVVVVGCQPVTVPATVALTCDVATPCPTGQACVDPDGLCVDVLDPCVFVDGAGATRLAEGASCGDGVICRARACVAPACGDQIVTSPETCDGGEGCRSDCTACGDGVVDSVEGCDDGAGNSDVDPGACRTDCRPAFCGDGVVDPGETCDGDRDCRADCSFCGDGTVDDDEQCDLGAANSDETPNACRADCVAAFCGDGVVDDGESCDGGPGCREDCSACGDGSIDDGEVCDTGVLLSDTVPDACRTACVEASCGDDITDSGEACDDGAANRNDPGARCRVDCRAGGCGDGILDPGEACDGTSFPAGVEADRCSDDCREVQRCGDRVLQQANDERCDDGNDNPIDGCDACRVQRLVVDPLAGRSSRGAPEVATSFPFSVAVDRDGAISVAENNNRIRRVSTVDGELVNDVIAGRGVLSLTGAGDNGPALLADLGSPTAIALDRFGNTFVAEGAGRVRRIDSEGIITTVAGGGQNATPTNGTRAVDARLGQVRAIAVDHEGLVYFADLGTTRVWRIDARGELQIIYTPSVASRRFVFALAFDGTDLVVSEFGIGNESINNHLLRMTRDGASITTLVTTGLRAANAIAVAGRGVYLLANSGRSHIACVDRSGVVTRIAGQNIDTENGKTSVIPEDGDPLRAELHQPRGVAVTPDGDIIIAESVGHFVRHVDADFVNATDCGAGVRRMTPLIGDGTPRDAGDGAPGLNTPLLRPLGLLAAGDRLLVADNADHRIREIDAAGVLDTRFGNSSVPDSIDDDVNRLFFPRIIIDDGAGGFFVAGSSDNVSFFNRGGPQVAHLQPTPEGTLARSTVVFLNDFNFGSGNTGTDRPAGLVLDGDTLLLSFEVRAFGGGLLERYALDGEFLGEVPGVAAPRGMVRRADGKVVVADAAAHQIFLLDGDDLTPLAGTGVEGDAGDGGNPLAAELSGPTGLALGDDGALYIADTGNDRIRVIRDGVIDAVVGTGVRGGGGDGGPALQAQLDRPTFIAVDANDRIAVVDSSRNTIRRVEDGVIDTIVGRTDEGFGFFSTAGIRSRSLLAVPVGSSHDLLSLGVQGRVSRFERTPCTSGPSRDCEFLELVVAGAANEAVPTGTRPANQAAELLGAGGMHLDRAGLRLLLTEARGLREVDLDPDGDGAIDPAEAWTSTPITSPYTAADLGGLALDRDGSLLVANRGQHCVQRLTLVGRDAIFASNATVLGDCGQPGSALADLFQPSDVVVGAAGAIYVSDTGNNRVVRLVPGGSPDILIGESRDASATGEGPAAARTFAVKAPRQLHIDRFGNLYIGSSSRLRVVTNTGFLKAPRDAVSGASRALTADEAEPDGDDGVINIYGGGDVFPEPETRCIEALAVVDNASDPDDGVAWVNDACFGTVARVRRVTIDD